MKPIIPFLILLSLVSCQKKEATPTHYAGTKLIAHRGNGSIGSGLEQSEENIVKACIKGFTMTDGVEVDVQRSNDHFIYLFHDESVDPCGELDIKSIPASTKDKIEEHFNCMAGIQRPNMLNELLVTHQNSYSTKEIFIDVKTIANIKTSLKMPSPQHYLNLMAQDIFDQIKNYKPLTSINIEAENAVMLNAFKEHYPNIKTWLASYGDFDKAIKRAGKENYTGISIKDGDYITKEHVQNAHRKGLKVCVWVVNDQTRYVELKAMEVDFVQTDNLYIGK